MNSLRIISRSTSAIPIEISEPKIAQVFEVAYSMIEIPPPFCRVCGKFITKNECSNGVVRPFNCPFNKEKL